MKDKTMRMPYVLMIISASAVITGCATTAQSPTRTAANFINQQSVTPTTQEHYPAKNPQHIAFYTPDESPHTAYRIIGVAKISKYNLLGVPRKQDTLQEMMKNLAASIGGDGIMNIEHNDDTVRANVIAFQKILI